MTHLTVCEWGKVELGDGPKRFSRIQADALLAAARAHPSGGMEGTNILVDHHRYMRAQQVVGVVAAPGCSLEILPKVDPDDAGEAIGTIRSRVVHMLDVVLGLGLSPGESAPLSHQSEALLDILIRVFAERLLAEVRRGLPRRYLNLGDDLPTLRGRLDVARQFATHAVRPDRIASRFDVLSANTPLLQVMKACASFLDGYARVFQTRRTLAEIRLALDEVTDVALDRLPWAQVRIDRTSRRWQSLYDLARLFMRRHWQATHHAAAAPAGISLLFPMNDLFEAYVAGMLRRELVPQGFEVVAQGGLRYCLAEWHDTADRKGTLFRTMPDVILKRHGRTVAIIDTKWKIVSANVADRKRGVAQADIYQMMAYAQLYGCDRLMLLYPHHGGLGADRRISSHRVAVAGRRDRIDIATVDVGRGPSAVRRELASLVSIL